MTSTEHNAGAVSLRGNGQLSGVAAGPRDYLDTLDPVALAAALRRAREGHPVLIAAELGIAGRRVVRPADAEEIGALLLQPTPAQDLAQASHAVSKARDWRRTGQNYASYETIKQRRGWRA